MKTVKPYQLVLVRRQTGVRFVSGYAHVGQVISYPFGDDVVNCRMVPDDPSTMTTVKLDWLAKPTATYRYVQYAKVCGVGSFPVDMLRYDFCCPVNFEFEETKRGARCVLNAGEIDLIVARAVPYKGQDWTRDRWNSFGWSIDPMKTLKIEGK